MSRDSRARQRVPVLSRRRLLRAAGLAGATGALAACSRHAYVRPSRVEPLSRPGKVVVVGAGFAGIGAAERLLEAGCDVEVLEARDRIGGRVETVSLGGYPADLGASWLRPSDNELYPFAEARGLLSRRTAFEDVLAVSGGTAQRVDVAAAQGKLTQSIVLPYLGFQLRAAFGGNPGSASLEELLGARLDELGVEGCALRQMVRNGSAAELDSLSGNLLLASSDVSDAELASEPTIKGGMSTLLDALVERSRPVLGEVVEVISRESGGVKVRTDKRVISADAVIVTASIGVLKRGKIVFDPGLSPSQQSALDHFDMGQFKKLWVRYPAGSWQPRANLMVDCDSSPIDCIFDFQASHGEPVLLGGAAGRNAVMFEKLPQAEARQLLHEELQRILATSLPSPTAFAMSEWGNDPWALGAYAYPNTGQRLRDAAELRQPLGGRILLAGEAIAEKNQGFVDGAWSDGRRAAGWVLAR